MPNLIPGYMPIPPLEAAHTFNDWKLKTNLIIDDLGRLAAASVITAAVTVNEAFAKSVIDYVPPAYIITGKLATNAAMDNISANTLAGTKLADASVPFGKLNSSTISITNAMLGLTDNLLSGAKLLEASVPISKLSYTNNAIAGNTLTRKTVYVNRMLATQENVLFGLGSVSSSNWTEATAEASELIIGAGLASVTNAVLTGTPGDSDVRGGRIYWKPNIVRTISIAAVELQSNTVIAYSVTPTGTSGNYLNADGSYTAGEIPSIVHATYIGGVTRPDYFLKTTIDALNNSSILITVQISGIVATYSSAQSYGFRLYKIVNSRGSLVEILPETYHYTSTSREPLAATFNYLDTTGVDVAAYPGTSPVISTAAGLNGTSAAGTTSNPIAAHNTYSTITYFVRYSSTISSRVFTLSAGNVSSMILQEIPN